MVRSDCCREFNKEGATALTNGPSVLDPAHPVIGLANAQYLSPDFHIWCNKKLLESGLIQVSDGELLLKLGEDVLPVKEKNTPAVISHQNVEVFGKPILVAVTEDGEEHVSIKHIYEAIGIDYRMQRKRIKQDEMLSKGVCLMTLPSAGGNQEFSMIPIEMMSGWLFKINPKRVAPAVEPKLPKYQADAYASAQYGKIQKDEDLSTKVCVIETPPLEIHHRSLHHRPV